MLSQKHSNQRIYIINIIIISIVSILSSFCLISCRSTNDSVAESNGHKASVQIRLSAVSNDQAEKQASLSSSGTSGDLVQKQIVRLDDDFYAEATLEPAAKQQSSLTSLSQASLNINPVATGPQEKNDNLDKDVKYKVVVYDSNGKYFTEQDCTSGSDPEITGLNGDETYTFIAYTIGSNSSLPIVNYTDPNNKTLSSATVNATGNDDLMYYTATMKVTGDKEQPKNILTIVFKRKFSRIRVEINATQTTYTIQEIDNKVNIAPHNTSAVIQLSDGNITRSGLSSREITFPSPIPNNTSIITSNPVMVNSVTSTNGQITIPKFTMLTTKGIKVSHSDVTFSNNKIAPGDYTLKITIKPTDKYLDYQGYRAVRLNGIIWMRHNLGVLSTNDPDQINNNNALTGNYYQWGRKKIVGTATTTNGTWDTSTTNNTSNKWNLGTEEVPVKNNTNDPCPNGWRVPTIPEYKEIYQIKKISYYNGTNSNSGIYFKSDFDSSVRISFPVTGFRDQNGVYNNNNNNGSFWESKGMGLINGKNYYSVGYNIENNFAAYTEEVQNLNYGRTVRCVAEYPIIK
ncbi:MAG: hypothetical protein LBE39_11880 [Flavobacteriaceae bacterium]|jgi:uncharacterized protein (TIGR02145 family)|nr:hypothetical protein [Flavobacteriaceae bacterium]